MRKEGKCRKEGTKVKTQEQEISNTKTSGRASLGWSPLGDLRSVSESVPPSVLSREPGTRAGSSSSSRSAAVGSFPGPDFPAFQEKNPEKEQMVRGDGHVPDPQRCGCGDRHLRSGVRVHVHYTGPPGPRSEIRKREPQGTEVSLHPSSCL